MKNEKLRDRLLGGDARDPGCEACFELLDLYAEALLRGDDVTHRFPEVVAHLESCEACSEDTEGLVAALRREATDEPR